MHLEKRTNVVEIMERFEYILTNKIGEGTYNVVFSAFHLKKGNVAVVVSKYLNLKNEETYKQIFSLQKQEKLKTDYMIACIDYIKIHDLKIVNAHEHAPYHQFIYQPVFIKIEEYGKQHFGEWIANIILNKTSIVERVELLCSFENRLFKIHKYFEGQGLYYNDNNLSNIFLREYNNVDSAMYIDLESFVFCNHKYAEQKVCEMVNIFFNDVFMYEFNMEKMKEMSNSKKWDYFDNFFDVKERNNAINLFNEIKNKKL